MESNINNGISLPDIGMGTWPLRGTQLEDIMQQALEVGYRLFDTADNYGNEEEIGNVLKRNASLRHEIKIMTKISDEKSKDINSPWSSIGKYFYRTSSYMQTHSAKDVVNMLVDNSLKKLKTDYIDCLIIHWPYPDYLLEIWDAMVELYKQGILKSIGVSNCRERHLELIKSNFAITPMVNQICISPLDTKQSVVNYCNKEGIQMVCYAPLMMMNKPQIQQSKEIQSVCTKYNLSLSQLLLAWNRSKGIIPIPKSTKRERLVQNFEAMNTILESEDITLIDSLNEDLQYLPESLFCPGL